MADWTTGEQQELEKKLDERNKLSKERKALIEKKAGGELTPDEAERLKAIGEQGAALKKEIDGLVQEKLDAAKARLQKDFPGSNVSPTTTVKPDDDVKDSWTAARMAVKDDKKQPEIDFVGVAWKTALRHSLSFLIANLQHESWELDCLRKYAEDHQLDFDKLIREGKSRVWWKCHRDASRKALDWLRNQPDATKEEIKDLEDQVQQADDELKK